MADPIHQPDLFAATAGVGGAPAARTRGTAAAPVLADSAAAADSEGTLAAELQHLALDCQGCRRCGLVLERQQVVVSRGNPQARLMVIGEGPGAQEDASGEPFVGRAGQLLDQMLASVGIDSNRDAYICNVVKCRPPGNRKPSAEEMAACLPHLQRQITLVNPAVILLAGATALEGVLGVKGGITRLRGEWRQWQGRWLMAVFHPSYLLRNPSRQQGSPKWLTWHDLQDVRRRLDQLAADPSATAGV